MKATVVLKMFAVALFAAVCVFVPVWQSAVNAKLNSQIAMLKEAKNILSEEKIILQAKVAYKTSPQYIRELATEKNLKQNADFANASMRVASNF